MLFFDVTTPLVFAHRGGCALGPENTLTAFDIGLSTGADGLELDVHLSADGIAVVHHDATLDRTTNLTGPISARTVAELAAADASCRFGAVPAAARLSGADAGGLRGVPTLRDVLRRYPQVPVIVEMKVDTEVMARAVADEVVAAGAVNRVCAAGAGLRSLRAIRKMVPDLATSACAPEVRVALYRSWARWPVRRPPYGGYQVPEHAGSLRVVSPAFVRHAHGAGLRVQVWTVDDEADMRRLLDWGVDALITNRPDVAVKVRDAHLHR